MSRINGGGNENDSRNKSRKNNQSSKHYGPLKGGGKKNAGEGCSNLKNHSSRFFTAGAGKKIHLESSDTLFSTED